VPAIVEELVQMICAGNPARKQEVGNLALVEHHQVEENPPDEEADRSDKALVRLDRGPAKHECACDSHSVRSFVAGMVAMVVLELELGHPLGELVLGDEALVHEQALE
jgi:hypothetical protein